MCIEMCCACAENIAARTSLLSLKNLLLKQQQRYALPIETVVLYELSAEGVKLHRVTFIILLSLLVLSNYASVPRGGSRIPHCGGANPQEAPQEIEIV